MAWKKPAGRAAGSPRTWSGGNGQHGVLERAAPLIPLRGRLEQRGRLAHHERKTRVHAVTVIGGIRWRKLAYTKEHKDRPLHKGDGQRC